MKFDKLPRHIENPNRQTVPFGCGLYCLNILFNEPEFMQCFSEEYGDRFRSMSLDDENDVLNMVNAESLMTLRITPVFMTNYLGESLVTEKLVQYLHEIKDQMKNGFVVPFFLGIKRTSHSTVHRIIIIVTEHGFVLIDPQKMWTYKTENVVEFLEDIQWIFELSRMTGRMTSQKHIGWSYVAYQAQQFPHLKLENIFSL